MTPLTFTDTLNNLSASMPGGEVSVGPLEDDWLDTVTVSNPDTVARFLSIVAAQYPGADARTQAALFMNSYSYYLLAAPLTTYLLAGRVPDLTPENVASRWVTYTWQANGMSGESLRLDVRFLSGRFAALPADQAPPADAVTVSDQSALRGYLRSGIEAHFLPLIETVHAQTRLSQGALWRLVADNCAALLLTLGQQTEQSAAAQQEGLALVQSGDSCLSNPQTGYTTVSAAGQTATFRARGGCCRYYTLPDQSKCTTCVLRKPAERDALLTAKLEQKQAGG